MRATSPVRASLLATLALTAASAVIPACTCSKSGGEGPQAQPSASAVSSGNQPAPLATAPAPSASGPERPQADGDVKPVYPQLTGPAHPMAQKLCDALYELPAKRRAECCSRQPSSTVTPECLRNLSGALSSGAVTLAEADVEKCQQALARDYHGCDWVAPFPPLLPPPPECQGIVKGTLKAGAVCRSSLECEPQLRCQGVGPTQAGRCAPARPAGACGTAIDVLATYARQDGYEREHPECDGYCERGRCASFAKAGAECKFNGQCGPGNHCEKGKCAPAETGKEGEACVGGRCAPGLACAKDRCVKPKKEGDACDDKSECRGRCVQDAGGKGSCKADCSTGLELPKPKAPPKKK